MDAAAPATSGATLRRGDAIYEDDVLPPPPKTARVERWLPLAGMWRDSELGIDECLRRWRACRVKY